jgi:hypothetical protein
MHGKRGLVPLLTILTVSLVLMPLVGERAVLAQASMAGAQRDSIAPARAQIQVVTDSRLPMAFADTRIWCLPPRSPSSRALSERDA